MSSALLAKPRVRPTSRLLTAADLAALPEEINGRAVKYELYDGELIIMAPPGGEHGRRQTKIAVHLHSAEERGLGLTFTEVGIVLRRNPDRVVGADAAFVLKSSTPVQFSREGYLATVPEIIVEVESRNDSDAELRSKCQEYFEAGAKAVWRIDPQSRTVLVAQADGPEVTLTLADTLTSTLLPGFSVAVAAIFA